MGITGALLTGLQGKENERPYGSHQTESPPAMVPCHRGRGGSEVSSNSHILYISSVRGVVLPGLPDVMTSIQHSTEEVS